jgi:hypothetical protein
MSTFKVKDIRTVDAKSIAGVGRAARTIGAVRVTSYGLTSFVAMSEAMYLRLTGQQETRTPEQLVLLEPRMTRSAIKIRNYKR